MEETIQEIRSYGVASVQQSRKAYMAPHILQIFAAESLMDGVQASISGSLNEPTTGIDEGAKGYVFISEEDIEEDTEEYLWDE